MSVSIEEYNLTQLIWAILTVAGFSSAMIIGILWIVKNQLRSRAGKIIDSVKKSHKQLLLAATPGHRANLFKVTQFLPGLLETAEFENRMSKKRRLFHEPERIDAFLKIGDLVGVENLSLEEKKQSLALTQECLSYILSANTDKVFLEDGVPLTLAIEDKTIVTSVKGIGALAFFEKLWKINLLRDKIAALENSATFRDVATYLKSLLSQVSLINIDILRNYFDSDYNQSDEESQNEYYFTMGYRKGKKGEKGTEKLFVYGGIAIGIAGIVGGAVLAYLK